MLIAPCILLASCRDAIEPADSARLVENERLAAKTFGFHPSFVNKIFTLDNIAASGYGDITGCYGDITTEHDYHLIRPFINRDALFNGVLSLSPLTQKRVSELFDNIGAEIQSKGDGRWPHRVRRCLYQILFVLEDIFENRGAPPDLSDDAIVGAALEYIHTYYPQKITLDALCKLTCVNRTSLTRMFRKRTGRSPIDYLLNYRLMIACESLARTKLSVAKIAESSGFAYESYFTRQFTAKIGITPVKFRQSDGFETLNTAESRIVEEF